MHGVIDIHENAITFIGTRDECYAHVNAWEPTWDKNTAYVGDIAWFRVEPIVMPMRLAWRDVNTRI